MRFLKKYPFHFILIIIFFLTHGYSENYGLIGFREMLLFFSICGFISLLSLFIFDLIFKSSIKAGLFITFLLILFLFFGAFIDVLAKVSALRYRFIIPVILLLIIGVFLFIKRRRYGGHQLNFFLNAALTLFILYDVGVICSYGLGIISPAKQVVKIPFHSTLTKCDPCNKPDIYFILLDEYSGSDVLQKYQGYDNSRFENFLRSQGFHVIKNPTSNYPTTILSITSTLNMSFIEGYTNVNFRAQNYSDVLPLIRKNRVTDYLISNNYKFYNHSIFDINEQPSVFQHHLFPSNFRLILDKTMLERMKKDMFIDTRIGPLKIKWGIEWEDEKVEAANAAVIRSTIAAGKDKHGQSKFVYTHLLMPHPPYRYDSLGNPVYIKLNQIPDEKLNNYYLGYLVYTNNLITKFLGDLQFETQGKAVIILMSDHGHRNFIPGIPSENFFHTINAIYLPDKQYKNFYDGLSNVNEFRILFNQLFRQSLPLEKDSSVYIKD